MRILRLDLEAGEELDLHPYVTVLGGLDPGLQRRVVAQIARIARGDVDGIGGLVEAHGLLVEIDPERIAALGLPDHADVIVDADQLPGARLIDTGRPESELYRSLKAEIATGEAEVVRLDAEAARIAADVERQSRELDDARRSVDEFAVTAHESAARAVVEAEALVRRRLGGTPAAPVAPEVAPPSPQEAERARLTARLDAQRRRHGDLETVLDEERLGLLLLLEQLEAERAALDALRAELAAEDPAGAAPVEPEPAGPPPELVAEVERLIAEVVAGPPGAPMVPSLPAAALADQVAAHRQRRDEFERSLIERGLEPGRLRDRLAYARRAEAEAAEAARPKTVSPADEAEIERLHDIVVDNADRRQSRRHGKEATRRYEEASAALGEVLGRYGFETYAAFVMGRTSPAVDLESRRRHDEARAIVASLERELAEVEAAIAEDPHGRMLRAEHDQIWGAARDLLGDLPDDLEAALRDLRVPGEVVFEAPDRLRDRLRRVGVDTSRAPTTGTLIEVADAWYRQVTTPATAEDASEPVAAEPTPLQRLAAQQALVDDLLERSRKLDRELSEREQAFDELADQIASTEAAVVALDDERGLQRAVAASAPEPDAEALLAAQLADDPTVRAAREQQALVAARLERHHLAVEQVDRLHAAIGEARRSEREVTARRDSLQVELDRLRDEAAKALDAGTPLPPVEWHLTDEGVGPIEWYLLGRVASLRSVSSAGSVPLVLNSAFRGLSGSDVSALCAALARIGETVQVIYLGDELTMVEWAEAQGLDRAAVVRPGQPAI